VAGAAACGCARRRAFPRGFPFTTATCRLVERAKGDFLIWT
jgi:hypothetical protein